MHAILHKIKLKTIAVWLFTAICLTIIAYRGYLQEDLSNFFWIIFMIGFLGLLKLFKV
jgi:hypothetical protein